MKLNEKKLEDYIFDLKMINSLEKLIKQRENLRASIQEWIDYDGNDGDAKFMEIFEQILKNN